MILTSLLVQGVWSCHPRFSLDSNNNDEEAESDFHFEYFCFNISTGYNKLCSTDEKLLRWPNKPAVFYYSLCWENQEVRELLVKTQDYQQRIIVLDILLWFGYSRRGRLLCLEFLQSSAGFGLLCHKETISPHFFSLIAAPDIMQPRNRFQITIFIKAFIKKPLFVRYLQFRYSRKECLLFNPDFHNQSDFISLQTMNTKEIIEFYFLLSCLHPVFL